MRKVGYTATPISSTTTLVLVPTDLGALEFIHRGNILSDDGLLASLFLTPIEELLTHYDGWVKGNGEVYVEGDDLDDMVYRLVTIVLGTWAIRTLSSPLWPLREDVWAHVCTEMIHAVRRR